MSVAIASAILAAVLIVAGVAFYKIEPTPCHQLEITFPGGPK